MRRRFPAMTMGLVLLAGTLPGQAQSSGSAERSTKHAFLGQAACSNCHERQNRWWRRDAHATSTRRLYEPNGKAVQLARLYGMTPDEMRRGDSVCMQCHGSVITRQRFEPVREGVGCESCHGPAGSWKAVHELGDPADGDQRTGYLQALDNGMNDLRDLKLLARTCSDCHYISDPKLLRVGHPRGYGFAYADGLINKVDHWFDAWEPPRPSTLTAAFDRRIAERGFPSVQRVSALRAPKPSARRGRRRGLPRRLPVNRPTVPVATAGSGKPLEAFPELAELSLEDQLRMLSRRLRYLGQLVEAKP